MKTCLVGGSSSEIKIFLIKIKTTHNRINTAFYVMFSIKITTKVSDYDADMHLYF